MKKLLIALLCGWLMSACALPPAKPDGPSVQHGFSTALLGLQHLLLSPLQVAVGLLEGIASVPYYLSTNLNEINKGLVQAQAKITLDDTYESAYGRRLTEVPESGDTGMVFLRMKHATEYFQKVLRQYGVADSQRYMLTAIDDNSGKYSLLAVVYRPLDSIQVIDKYNDGRTLRNFTSADRLFYEPFKQDANGKVLDTVIDWAGLPKEVITTQKAQAVLITLSANAVLSGKKSPEYWDMERRWLGGGAHQVVEERGSYMRSKMGL
jgi:hypothetical protein